MGRILVGLIVLAVTFTSPSFVLAQGPTSFGVVLALEWSPDGSSIAYVSTGGAWLYIVGDKTYSITSGDISSVSWSPDGNVIALGKPTGGKNIEIWNVEIPQKPRLVRQIEDVDVFVDNGIEVDWNPVNNLLAITGRGVRVWDVASGSLITHIYPEESTISVAWSPNGFWLGVHGLEGLKIWDVAAANLKFELPHWGNDFAWNVDGTQIAAYQNREITIWSLSQPSPIQVTMFSHRYAAGSPHWTGNTLAVFLVNGDVLVWNTDTGQELTTISNRGFAEFAISPDGSQIAYVQDGEIMIQVVNESYVVDSATSE